MNLLAMPHRHVLRLRRFRRRAWGCIALLVLIQALSAVQPRDDSRDAAIPAIENFRSFQP